MQLSELIPYANNPRHNDEAVDKVAASIREFGFKVPIIVDKDNVIVAGHTRLKAAQKLGFEKVPVIRADDLTDEQVKAFRLVDNKTQELAGWDFSKLDEELCKLDFPMEQFGFENADIRVDDFGDLFSLPDGEKPKEVTMTFSLHRQQAELIEAALLAAPAGETFGNRSEQGNALYAICCEWAESGCCDED